MDFKKKAEEAWDKLWDAMREEQDKTGDGYYVGSPFLATALEQSYRAGMKALETELIELCQNGGQSWAWVKEAASRLRRAYDDKRG